jgi:hypothetical protein
MTGAIACGAVGVACIFGAHYANEPVKIAMFGFLAFFSIIGATAFS